MSKKLSRTLERKIKMQEKMEQMEKEMKELEIKAYEEVGRFLFKEWEIDGEVDSEIINKAIVSLKDQAKEYFNRDEVQSDMGKSEE